VIWHTNDLHGRLSQRAAERLRQLRETTPGSLLLDAGDALAAGNLFWRRKEPVLERMRLAGYDAMCLGNREFHLWQIGFASKLRDCPHPVLCANLKSGSRPLPPRVQPDLVIETAFGLRLGLIGLTVPMVTRSMAAARLSHYLFENPVQAAKREVATLRAQCQMIIALSHLGLKRDRELVQHVPEIDLVIGAHSHTPLNQPEQHAGRYIVQSVPYAKAVGRLELEIASDKVALIGGELVAL